MTKINSGELSVIDWQYYLLLVAFKSSNIKEGIAKALYLTKLFFNASDVILYKLNEDDDYIHKFNQPLMDNNSETTTSILNSAKRLIETKQYFKMDFDIDIDNLHNILFIPIFLNDIKYVIAITYSNQLVNFNDNFIDMYIKTMHIILEKLEFIKGLSRIAETDSLTGLGNRIAYDMNIDTLEIRKNLILGLFDLFNLKGVNDHYSHYHGDEYIRRTAEVLKKYFPAYIYTVDKHGKKEKVQTGTHLYRIGGDEFALISDSETYHSALIKIKLVEEEIKHLDLGVNEPLRINYGLVSLKAENSFRELSVKADDLLSKHKTKTYQILNIERRSYRQ